MLSYLDGGDDYQNLLKEMNGLTIKIEYEEDGNDFVGNGYATITIQDGKATLDGEYFGDEFETEDSEFDDEDEGDIIALFIFYKMLDIILTFDIIITIQQTGFIYYGKTIY